MADEEGGLWWTNPGALDVPKEEPTSQPRAGGNLGRDRFIHELDDPATLDRLIAYTRAEVGGQGPEAEQAFIESTFNRSIARNQHLNKTLSGPYFPAITHQNARRPLRDDDYGHYAEIIGNVLGGSNITNYATGNASGSVGFAGGPQTARFGGEKFGIEGPDRDWWRRVGAGQDGAINAGLTAPESTSIPSSAQPTQGTQPMQSAQADGGLWWVKNPPVLDEEQTAAPTTMPTAGTAVAAEEPTEAPGFLSYPWEAAKSAFRTGAATIGSGLRGEGTLAAQAPYGSAVPAMVAAGLPEGLAQEEAVRAEERATALGLPQRSPATEPLTRAGAAIEEAGARIAPSGKILNPFVEDVAGAVGSIGANIALSAINPSLGGRMLLSQGVGEAQQSAEAKKATPEQQQQAGSLGTIAGATELVDALLPFLGTPGRIAGLIGKVGARVLHGAFLEGGQEYLQQVIQNAIAKGVYDPNKDVTEGALYSGLVAAVAGGGVSAIAGGREPTPPVPPIDERLKTFVPEPRATEDGNKMPGAIGPGEALQDIHRRDANNPLFVPEPTPPFYSQLLRTAEEKLPETGSIQQVMATLRNAPGVKEEEIRDVGLDTYLASQEGKVKKKDVVEWLEQNQIQVETAVSLSADDRPSSWTSAGGEGTQFAEYTAPGPKSGYMELRLKLPPGKPGDFGYLESHWEDPNVVAHVRATTRSDSSGNPVLHIEEIQSDWHQQGRTYGMMTREDQTEIQGLMQERNRLEDEVYEQDKKLDDLRTMERHLTQTMARMAPEAAARLAPDLTEIQTNRRNLIARTDEIMKRLDDVERRRQDLRYGDRGFGPEKVPNAPFKSSWVDLAIKRMFRWAADHGYEKISWSSPELAAAWATGAQGNLQGVSAKTREGLKEFYGKIVPSRMKSVAKKFGGVLGETRIEVPTRTGTVSYRYQPAPMGDYEVIQVEEGRNELVIMTFSDEQNAQEYTRRQNLNEMQLRDQALTAPAGNTVSVYHVTVPVAARTAIQRGLTLYNRPVVPGPASRVVVKPGTVASREEIDNANKMVAIFNDFARKFKFENKVTLQLQRGMLDTDFPNARGLATNFKNGTYLIQLDLNRIEDTGHFYEVMMHEFGHVNFWENWSRTSETQKNLIRADHNRFLDSIVKDPRLETLLNERMAMFSNIVERTEVERMSLDLGASLGRMSDANLRYHLSFEEYVADQTARWATTNEVPITVVEKYYKSFATSMKHLFDYFKQRLGLSPTAAPSIESWLNSFTTEAVPASQDIYARTNLSTQKQNQSLMQRESGDPDVPGVPHTPEVAPIRNAMSSLFGGNPPASVGAGLAHADKISWHYKKVAGLLELRDANPNFPPVHQYVEAVKLMDEDESKLQDSGTRIAKSMRSLGRHLDGLVNFLDELANMTYLTPQEQQRGVTRQPTLVEMQAIAKRVGLTPKAAQVGSEIKKYFDGMLDLVRQNAIAKAMQLTDPRVRAIAVDQVNAMTDALKQRPYFPFMRFGRYFVTVKDTSGKVIHFETFERSGLRSAEKRQQRKAQELRDFHGTNATVTTGLLPETSEPFVGLPPALLQHIADKMTLTPAQLDALEQLQFQLSPALSFKHHFQQKNFTPGYSKDFIRAFSRYAFSGARYYARTKHLDGLRDIIKDTRKITNDNKAHKIADFMADHLQNNVLDATGDYGKLKGLIFLWQLAFVPASALQNLSQTPMVTLPYLGHIFGGPQAGLAIGRAMTQISNFQKKGQYPPGNTPTEWQMRAIGYGIRSGHISETQAAELAHLAQGNNLLYGAGGTDLQRASNWALEKGATMFETAEQFNRRVAFRAALELAAKNPNNRQIKDIVGRNPRRFDILVRAEGFTPAQAQAITFALDTVDKTQFVYKRYARPAFMRGPVLGAVFVFHRYVQALVYLNINNKSFMWRYMLIAMLVGGLGGIPGYEDLKDMVEGVGRRLGYDIDWDRAIRKFVLDYANGVIPPDMVLGGLARRGMGVPAILDMMGSLATGRPGRGFSNLPGGEGPTPGQNVPFPQFDMSRMLSPNPLLPITGKIFDPTISDKDMINETQRAGGAIFSAGTNIVKAIGDNQLAATDPKRWERAVPRIIAGISKTFRTYNEGRERSGPTASGTTIVNYDVRDTEQLMEVIGFSMGFNNLRQTGKWEYIMAQKDHDAWIKFNKDGLLKQFREAKEADSSVELDNVKRKISEFNDGLSDADKPQRITGDTIIKSLQGATRERIGREIGVPVQRGKVRGARELQELYPEATIDVRKR